jgi:hypothetical protein
VQQTDNERRALERILDRAAMDPAFRARLLTEPREAILETFGVSIPSTFRIKFVERGPDVDALVVLPDMRRFAGELSDDDLEPVSGGAGRSDWAEAFFECTGD